MRQRPGVCNGRWQVKPAVRVDRQLLSRSEQPRHHFDALAILGKRVPANLIFGDRVTLVDPPPLTNDAFDVCMRFGEPPDARIMAWHLASKRRLLCASPACLASHGGPQVRAFVDFLAAHFERLAIRAEGLTPDG